MWFCKAQMADYRQNGENFREAEFQYLLSNHQGCPGTERAALGAVGFSFLEVFTRRLGLLLKILSSTAGIYEMVSKGPFTSETPWTKNIIWGKLSFNDLFFWTKRKSSEWGRETLLKLIECQMLRFGRSVYTAWYLLSKCLSQNGSGPQITLNHACIT